MDHDVTTLVVDNDAIPDDPSVAQRARLAVDSGLVVTCARRLVAKRIAERPVDILHAHNTFPLLSPSIYGAARRSGAAVVQTIHNYRTMYPAGYPLPRRTALRGLRGSHRAVAIGGCTPVT